MLIAANLSELLPILAVTVLLALLIWVFERAFISPLNTIPGPWIARFSGLPYFYHSAIRQQQAQYVEFLHKTYGPVVRIGPNEVGVATLEGVKAIHKIGAGFAKSPWYDYIAMTKANHGPPGLFQMRDFHEHAERRRLLARGFTVSSLRKDWEDMVRGKAEKAVAAIGKDIDAERSVDVRKWWLIMASDVVSELVFGKSFGGLGSGKNSTFSEAILRINRINMLAMMFPWIYSVLRKLPVSGLQPYFNADKELADIASIAVENSRSDATGRNVFSNILAQAVDVDGNNDGTLTDKQITIEAGNLISAGSDTTAETLTYLTWAVLGRPELQRLLEQEVAAAGDNLHDSELEKLPVLNSVIQETLRLYPASPFPQPRVVPKGDFRIEGFHLPEDTVVSTSPWVLHRDPNIFPDPDRFDHSRWLRGGSGASSETAKAAWWPFGAGARVCLGRHLAMMEIRFATALFFRRFRGARLAPDTTDASMAMNNFVILHPAGGACKILLPDSGL